MYDEFYFIEINTPKSTSTYLNFTKKAFPNTG